jgi:LPXTG-motif cell wall-anchored protein
MVEEKEIIMYIDPNTGGMLFQALAIGLAAISGVLLIFSRKIRETFAKMRRKSRENEEPKE